MKSLSPIWKRIGLGLIGFLAALAAALAALEGGSAMTLSQMGQIPLLSWILALGAFMTGVIGKHDEVQK